MVIIEVISRMHSNALAPTVNKGDDYGRDIIFDPSVRYSYCVHYWLPWNGWQNTAVCGASQPIATYRSTATSLRLQQQKLPTQIFWTRSAHKPTIQFDLLYNFFT